MTEVVKFNIGGQRYDVSRSLLQMHPDSMLAKSASDQWQEDPEAEIFIEGDGSLFRYILTYLRHGLVSLPITESKEALMKELEYYGIEADDDDIDDKAARKAKTLQSSMTIVELKDKTGKAEVEYRCAQLALDCICAYFQARKRRSSISNGNESYDLTSYLDGDKQARENIDKLYYDLQINHEKAREGVNVHLNCVGLHLSSYRQFSNGTVLEELDTAQRNMVEDK